jgi:hypothetical protein
MKTHGALKSSSTQKIGVVEDAVDVAIIVKEEVKVEGMHQPTPYQPILVQL